MQQLQTGAVVRWEMLGNGCESKCAVKTRAESDPPIDGDE